MVRGGGDDKITRLRCWEFISIVRMISCIFRGEMRWKSSFSRPCNTVMLYSCRRAARYRSREIVRCVRLTVGGGGDDDGGETGGGATTIRTGFIRARISIVLHVQITHFLVADARECDGWCSNHFTIHSRCIITPHFVFLHCTIVEHLGITGCKQIGQSSFF